MVGGCVDIGNMEITRNFYDVMPEQNVLSCIKMINGYSKKGVVESAREVFNEMNEKDHLVCNSMITYYAQNGWLKKTLENDHRKYLEECFRDREDNTILASVEDGSSCVISKKEFWGSLDQNRRHGLLDPE
uniref:Pentatricopeptide repeat-containing protein n=1 Tax=Tanacetum cinerariifolium TaxID=118510 RepID=A0A699INR5_TANCI|nr:pentatricopeptide repeat-containing protein [Tanacetum cinerariifolium]